jgi:hypothetical protein
VPGMQDAWRSESSVQVHTCRARTQAWTGSRNTRDAANGPAAHWVRACVAISSGRPELCWEILFEWTSDGHLRWRWHA